jgi:hypothetical protein
MRIAILQIRHMPDAYFFDTLNVLYAGDLREDGHEVRVYDHNTFGVDEDGDAYDGLRQALETFEPEVLLFERVHTPDLVASLRTASVLASGVLHQQSAFEHEGVDFTLPYMDRAPVRAAIQALQAEGLRGLKGLAGVCTPERALISIERPSVDKLFSEFDLAYDLVETTRISSDPGPLRKHVFGNLGCPYRNAPNRTGFMDGIEVPAEITDRGCTFCDRPDYDRIRPDRALDLIRAQLNQVQESFPKVEQLILVDEYALRYVDQFVALLNEEVEHPVEVFFSARIDYIHKFRQRFEDAITMAGPHLNLVMYLVGIENFSPFELWRFNKGVTVQSASAGLEVLDRLSEAQPQFRVEPSFGFVLFTPWTTPTDLYLNWLYLKKLRFDRWRESAVLTRLRLYPENALYYKAQAQGLLASDHAEGSDASDRYGYESETPWSFKDSRVQAIYDRVYSAQSGSDAHRILGEMLQTYREEIQAQLDSMDLTDNEAIARFALA